VAKKKELVKKTAGALAKIDFGADAGAGFEDTDSKCFAIPILRVIQSGSPQVKKTKPEYNEDAREGMLVNSVTQELFDGDKGLLIIPCYFLRTINEWPQRGSKESKSVKIWSVVDGESLYDDCTEGPKGEMFLPNGHQLVDTRNHYVLVINPRTKQLEPCFFPLSSTQIKNSKRWLSQMNAFKLEDGRIKPMFSQVYHLTTVPDSNEAGDWSAINIAHVSEVVDVAQYSAARAFREMVRSGVAKVADETEPAY
jgi:hypothetical protein